MTEFNKWIIEKKYIIHFPANINSLTPKQFLKLIELYYNRHDNIEFRTRVFFNIAKTSIKTKFWLWWSLSLRKKNFADGDFEHVIKLFTDFLIENNEDEELLGKQLVPIIYVPKYSFLGKYGPKTKLKGFDDLGSNMSFADYREAEKGFFSVNLKEEGGFEMLISALYRGEKEVWQIRSIPEVVRKAVYFQYNDLREYWKRSYPDVFEGGSSSSDEKTSDDVEEDLQVWRHYVADEDPTKYESVDNQNIYNILFAWNEIRKRQKKEKELLEEQKQKR
jgi:hypothetical protein